MELCEAAGGRRSKRTPPSLKFSAKVAARAQFETQSSKAKIVSLYFFV